MHFDTRSTISEPIVIKRATLYTTHFHIQLFPNFSHFLKLETPKLYINLFIFLFGERFECLGCLFYKAMPHLFSLPLIKRHNIFHVKSRRTWNEHSFSISEVSSHVKVQLHFKYYFCDGYEPVRTMAGSREWVPHRAYLKPAINMWILLLLFLFFFPQNYVGWNLLVLRT